MRGDAGGKAVSEVLTWLIRIPVGVALVIGVAALVRHRRRSRKAAGLGSVDESSLSSLKTRS